MNRALRILAFLLASPVFAATPPQSVDLDLSQTARAFRLQFAEGTTPLLRGNVKNAGTAYTVTGWTATLYLSATWDDTQVIAIPSTTTGSTYFDFQMTGTHTSTNGVFTANIIATDGTATVEWQRGEVEIRPSPGSSGAGTITLSTPLSWSGYTYSNTGGGGPYRAGSNVVFTINGDGSANINADVTAGSGDVTGITSTDGSITVTSGTGPIPNVALPSTLPARNGSLLTAINAATLGGVLPAGYATTNSVAVAIAKAHDAATVAGGMLTLSGQQIGLATNAVRAAVSGLYLSIADGGTVAGSTTFTEAVAVNAGFTINGDAPLTSENGGEGSAYDADKLDGQHGAYYRNWSSITNTTGVIGATQLASTTVSAASYVFGNGGFTVDADGRMTSATSATGNLITDADKGDVTVGSSGTTFTVDPSTITSAKIVDGTIVGADLADAVRTVTVPVSAWKGPLDTEIPGWAYKSYATTNTTTTVCEGLVNYETTQRTATIDANFKTPAEATAWKTTGAIVFQFFGDSTTTSEVCYRVYVYRDGTSAAIYDTGATQALASATGVTTLSIPASSLGTFYADTGYTIRVQPSVKFATTAKGFYFHNVTVQVIK